jgi:hypothetical protein
METITCGSVLIEAEEIEQTGGFLNPTTDFTDTLFRGRDGHYYLEERTSIPLPENATYTLPRDREWMDRMEQEKISIREIGEKEALLWAVDSFINDERLTERLTDLIGRFA